MLLDAFSKMIMVSIEFFCRDTCLELTLWWEPAPTVAAHLSSAAWFILHLAKLEIERV